MASGAVDLPVPNSTEPPSDVTTGKPVAAFCAAILSAMRPPHPVADGPVDTELCHCACWSECEKSDAGTCPATYCDFDVGCTSVPTLHMTASLRWLNSVASSVQLGCRPNGVPRLTGWIGASEACAICKPDADVRTAAYCAYPALSIGTIVLLPSLPPYRNTQTSAL